MTGNEGRTIAVVGGGFAGTLVTINLLRAATRPTRVVLIERAGVFGAGIAYADRDFPYMLNVPASAMSATGSAPDEFLLYAQRSVPVARGDDFMPRALYGAYLAHLLEAAAAAARAGVTLVRRAGSVIDIGDPERPELQFVDGTRLAATDVVLALGNPPAADPFPPPGLAGLPGVRPDPWTRVPDSDPTQPLLIIGSGLTMADVVCEAIARSPERRIHVLSRHGLLPPEQTNFDRMPAALATHPFTTHPIVATPSLRRLVATARRLVREVERLGGDWRSAIAAIRHEAPTLWSALPMAERRRFLRHLRSHWDRFRHRLPGSVRARIDALRVRGQLRVHAGRLLGVEADGNGLRVRWQPRGHTRQEELRVGEVANCTGPDYDVRRSTEPLWSALLGRGVATADELGLGIRTASHGALVDARRRAQPHLYYLGPMLRADHWEVTGAAELRTHAEALARHLLVRDRAKD
jgi:uncharacterized NAD(P)/FAD-binding protein YdhS